MRYRLYPTPQQAEILTRHCADARYIWNLALEQWNHWQPGFKHPPGYVEQTRQLTELRQEVPWVAEGSVIVQQRALRDFHQAWSNFFGGTHDRPTWRRKGAHEGFRTVAVTPGHVQRLNRHWGQVRVPKAGWVRFRWSPPIPPEATSYRVRFKAGRWHIAFAVKPEPMSGPGDGSILGIDRGVVIPIASSDKTSYVVPGLEDRERRIEDLRVKNMSRSARGTQAKPGRKVRQKASLNRSILQSGWGFFAKRLEDKAPYRVERVNPAFSSQRCLVCGYRAAENRESQAVLRCQACGYMANADFNAAETIAGGHPVTARGGMVLSGLPRNREPQLSASLVGVG